MALMATSINSVLWGGIFNPIISITPYNKMQGLLKTFDPDYLVDLTHGSLPKSLDEIYNKRIITATDLVVNNHYNQRQLNIGLRMEIIHDYIRQSEGRLNRHFRFILQKDAPDEWKAYISFSLGDFRSLPNIDINYYEEYNNTARAVELVFNPKNIIKDYESWMSPIDATAYDIRKIGGRGACSFFIAYIGDHTNLQDLLEFWNIRATGRDVWFFPINHFENHIHMLKRIVRTGRYYFRADRLQFLDLQKSPSISDEQYYPVQEWITTNEKVPIRISKSSPRFGESIDYCVDDINAVRLEVRQSEENTLS